MEVPYLIQRASVQNNKNSKGIDSVLSFDYMGSAEFEFGALPDSLKRVRMFPESYTQFQYSFGNYPSKVVTVLCKKEQQDFVGDILESLSENKIRLKGYSRSSEFVKDGNSNTNFWWDIDNDWFFWVLNPDFDLQFKKLLFEEK